jgi:hypothetical protein
MGYGAVVVGRNDNYGENLCERATYSLNSMISELDSVIYVDWNTEIGKKSLIEEIKDDLIHSGKLIWTKISPDLVGHLTPIDSELQSVCEVLARNIGIRALTTDFIVSTNIDIVCPDRNLIEKQNNQTKLYTAGKRNIPMEIFRTLGDRYNPAEYKSKLKELENSYGQQPVVSICDGDVYSLVSGCGDWQLAHKNIWYTIRGFEERLYKRMRADTNLHRKASIFGFDIGVDWELPVWHINHGGGSGGAGGENDINLSVFMNETTNLETWGFSNLRFDWNIL